MLSSRETAASGVPGASSDSSISPGTVSASARRWEPDSQLAIRFRMLSVALLAVSDAERLDPGPGFDSTSPSSVRSRVHPCGPVWAAPSLIRWGPGLGSTSPSW
eukprot:8004794-Alexandrium_andersonii.AAC.1